MADIDDTIEYYKELILYQYINNSKSRATIGLLVTQALVDLLPTELSNSFNIDTAVGDQLDILGEYIGLSRTVSVPLDKTYMNMADQDSLPANYYGFTDYNSEINRDYYFRNYIENKKGTINLLDDEYRTLLKLKILTNQSTHTLYEMNQALYDAFGMNIYIKDYMNMGILYMTTASYKNMAVYAESLGVLPKPMGVGIIDIITQSTLDDMWDMRHNGSTENAVAFSDYNSGMTDAVFWDTTDDY